jgi:nitrate reductase gamma subunit
MIRVLPIFTLAAGIMLCVIGFAWAIATGTALPDQDPTPAMAAYANRHEAISGTLMLAGLVVAACGVVAVFAQTLLWLRRRSRTTAVSKGGAIS